MSQIAVTKILDGPRNAVFHVSIVGDAVGDLTDETIIDPATSFDPAYPAKPGMSIDGLWYDLTGFDAWIEFDYLVSDTPAWSMSGGQAVNLDFCPFGGIKDRSNAMDGTGKLTVSTNGLAAGDRGTFIVKIHKG
jgi:hypothetical protein